MYEIGTYLRCALKKRGMKQKELASAMNMSQEHISKICLNKDRPSMDALIHICTILNMTFSEFFDQGGEDSMIVDARERELLRDYRQLAGYERDAISALTASLSKGRDAPEE